MTDGEKWQAFFDAVGPASNAWRIQVGQMPSVDIGIGRIVERRAIASSD